MDITRIGKQSVPGHLFVGLGYKARHGQYLMYGMVSSSFMSPDTIYHLLLSCKTKKVK